MKDEFETPDLDDFIAACAKQFCPYCGKPIERKPGRGRPRVFCSDRCRWNTEQRMWRERRRKLTKEKMHEDSSIKNTSGEGSEAGSLQPEEEAETGR